MLTEVAVRNAKPKEKPYKLTDEGGMYLLVQPNGSKYWRLNYRFHGKQKTLPLGVYPKVKLAEARQRRLEAKQNLESGIDPAAKKKETKVQAASDAFEVVAREWHSKHQDFWSKKYADDVLKRLENVFPDIGGLPMSEIKPARLLESIQKIEKRGSPDQARRVLRLCGEVFRYGIPTGRCEYDIATPLKDVLVPHKPQNQAAVHMKEIPALLKAIKGYDQIGDLQTRLATELLAHTFTRTVELIAATWEEIDEQERIWTVPASRMKMGKEHLVPLSRQSLAILKQLRQISGRSHLIFPGRNMRKPISNNTILFALYRLGYKSRMTGHGFRALASTVLNESGKFRPDVIERQLAHVEGNSSRRPYNRAEYLPERREMMQWWSDYLDEAATKD